MKKRSLWLCPLAIAAIVALDQWVKAYIVTHFAVGESKPFLPQLLRLHYVRNFCSRGSCGTRSACGR